MRDEEVRRMVGVSRLRLASLLGVDRVTIAIYEAAPERVGPVRRAAFAIAYGSLRLVADAVTLARLVIRRKPR